MMKKIIALLVVLDWFILGRVEKFAHKFQRLTGKTNFWLAKICNSFEIGVVIASDILTGKITSTTVLLIDAFLVVVYISINIFIIPFLEKIRKENMSRGLANGGKMKEASLDRVLLTMMYVWIAFIVKQNYVSMIYVAAIAFLYFISCDSLPPCKSSVMEWVKGIFASNQSLALVSKKV